MSASSVKEWLMYHFIYLQIYLQIKVSRNKHSFRINTTAMKIIHVYQLYEFILQFLRWLDYSKMNNSGNFFKTVTWTFVESPAIIFPRAIVGIDLIPRSTRSGLWTALIYENIENIMFKEFKPLRDYNLYLCIMYQCMNLYLPRCNICACFLDMSKSISSS